MHLERGQLLPGGVVVVDVVVVIRRCPRGRGRGGTTGVQLQQLLLSLQSGQHLGVVRVVEQRVVLQGLHHLGWGQRPGAEAGQQATTELHLKRALKNRIKKRGFFTWRISGLASPLFSFSSLFLAGDLGTAVG